MKRAWIIVCLVACHGDSVDETVGATCRDDLDCSERCEGGGDFPDGFCTLSCIDDLDCPSDTLCADVHGGVCVFACERDAHCDFLGPHYVCREKRDFIDRRVFVCLGS